MIKHSLFIHIRLLAVLALLGASFVGFAQNIRSQDPRAVKSESRAAKLTPNLLKISKNKGVVKETPVNGLEVVEDFSVKDGAIAIEAVASNGNGQGLLKALQRLGLREGQAYKGMIFGYIPIDRLGELANLPELVYARPYEKPITNTGSVTSQGDKSLRADIARANYGVTGDGSKVGVLSDSYNYLGGAAAGIASGDLPAAGVQVLEDYSIDNPSDEGRAMAEIIHDVAPGAAIAFNTAFTGQVGFANGIKALAAAGCNIIVDDVIYFFEPFFMDGIIAQAVDEVVNNNQVTYFSSAGNEARSSYQAGFVNSGQVVTGWGEAHNFGGGDIRQTITIPGLSSLILVLQWDDPFRSVTGSAGAQTDLDLLVYFNNILRTDFSSFADNLTGDPVEGIGLRNNGASPANIEIVITKFAGPDPGTIKWVNFGSRNIVVEYDTKSSASTGHTNAAGAISVGAAPYFNTPAFNPALTTAIIESFSSAGGTPTLFTNTGDRIPNGGIVRQKPEITGPDGGNTTFFGFDYEGDGFPNFFGTSASAPHNAAVAALMKERSGNLITRNGILAVMQQTALDMDDPLTPEFDSGFDFRTGYGFIQADAAVLASSITDLVITPSPSEICEGESSNLLATFNGGLAPFTYTWETTGGDITNTDTPTATASNLPPGDQTITVTVKDANNISNTTTTIITVAAASTWYLDVDGDGYYVSTLQSCTYPGEGYKATGNVLGDCDDNDVLVWQTADLYIDVDSDGYDAGIETVCYGESIPTGYSLTTNGTDCNDSDSNINPGAVEICGNGIDDNCNGQIDEGCGICPLPQGEWKNNTSEWPASALPMGLGTTRTYSKAQLLSLLNEPTKSDASVILAVQLIAAKLNVANGASTSQEVLDAIAAADAAIGNRLLPAKVKSNSTLGRTMTTLGVKLEEYNKGMLNGCYVDPTMGEEAMRKNNDGAGQTIERVIELNREPRLGDFNMYPNPTESEVTLEVELDQTVNVGIRIFDAVGRLVYEEEGIKSGNTVYQINIDHLSSGLYTVQVSTGQLVMNKRLIKK
jgi:hypothetical protein